MGLSIRDMAQALGVSKSQVSRDKLSGMPMTSPEAARAWRLAQHDMSRTVEGRIDRPGAPDTSAAAVGSVAPAAGAGGVQAPPAGEGLDDDPPRPTDTEEYRRWRAERERIRMEREQHEFDRDRGNSIALAEAQRLAFTAFRALRDGAMSIPARVKDLCAAKTDAAEIEQLLEAELAAVFEVDPAALLRDTADEDDDDAA